MPSFYKAKECKLALGLNFCVFEPIDSELTLNGAYFYEYVCIYLNFDSLICPCCLEAGFYLEDQDTNDINVFYWSNVALIGITILFFPQVGTCVA